MNEFTYYLEGAQQTKEQRMRDIPEDIMREMRGDVDLLFEKFDIDGSKTIEADELVKAMRSMGYDAIDESQATQMIAQVPGGVKVQGKMDRDEF